MFKTGKSLSAQYEQLKAFVAHLKSQCIRHRDQTRDIKTTVDELLPLLNEANNRLAVIPNGLLEYAQQQEADPLYDVATELATLRTAVQESIAWIVAAVPQTGGTVDERILNPDGSVTNIVVDTVVADSAVAQIQTVIDAIE